MLNVVKLFTKCGILIFDTKIYFFVKGVEIITNIGIVL